MSRTQLCSLPIASSSKQQAARFSSSVSCWEWNRDSRWFIYLSRGNLQTPASKQHSRADCLSFEPMVGLWGQVLAPLLRSLIANIPWHVQLVPHLMRRMQKLPCRPSACRK